MTRQDIFIYVNESLDELEDSAANDSENTPLTPEEETTIAELRQYMKENKHDRH